VPAAGVASAGRPSMTALRPAPVSDTALPPAAARIFPRRRLPGVRVLAGGFAVAVAAILVFVAYLGAQPGRGQPGVVAAGPLAAGTRLTPADLRVVDVRLPEAVRFTAFSRVGQLLGRSLSVSLAAGELLTRSELVARAATPALRPVPVTVAPSDVADLAAGDRVDVLLTEGSAPGTRTRMVLRGAVVESTSQPSNSLAGSGQSDVVTLGVATLPEVEAVVGAEHAGTVDLVVGEPADGSGLGAGASAAGGAAGAAAGSSPSSSGR